MKRFFYTIILMGLMVIFMDPAEMLMSKFLRLDEPTTHEIQEGEWLSKVAQKYYGDASYWKELALINRAPDGNLIFPGEKIVVPNFDAIQRIRNSRSLSSVNEIVGIQQDILAGRIEHRTEPLADAEKETEPTSQVNDESGKVSTETSEPQVAEVKEQTQPLTHGESQATNGEGETAFFLSTPVLTGLVILAVILAIGIFMYVRSKKREEVSYYGDASEDEDVEVKEKNVYYYDDSDEESNGKRKKKREVEVVEN